MLPRPILFLSLAFTLTLAKPAVSAPCDQISQRFTPPTDAAIVLPWTEVDFDDFHFCQMSYRTRQSVDALVDKFAALFLKWHGSEPQTSRTTHHVSLFGAHPEYTDYVEIIRAENRSIVSLSFMRPSDSDSPLSTQKTAYAGLPVKSQSRIGDMVVYQLETPYGITAAKSQLHAHLEQTGWQHKPAYMTEAVYLRGESFAVVETQDKDNSLTLMILSHE